MDGYNPGSHPPNCQGHDKEQVKTNPQQIASYLAKLDLALEIGNNIRFMSAHFYVGQIN